MIRIWDLPTRLFHWLLVLLVSFSIVSANIGGNWLDWHIRSGYCVLTLLLFRIMWGFAGSHHARFANFVRSPAAVLAYLRALRGGTAPTQAGHNPLGALSVLALVAVLLLQASTGLFANDDSTGTEGPLAKLVSNAASNRFTFVHEINQYVIYALIALHLGAIAYYFAKGENLVVPMLTGDKRGSGLVASSDDAALRIRAAVLLAVAAALAGYIATR